MQPVKFPFQRSQLKPKDGKPSDSTQPSFLLPLSSQPSYSLPAQFPLAPGKDSVVDFQRKPEEAEAEGDAKSAILAPFLPEETKELKCGVAERGKRADSREIARRRGFAACGRRRRSKSPR